MVWHTFTGRVESPGGTGETSFLEIPPEVVAALSQGKRPPVAITLNGYTFRTTVAVYADAIAGAKRDETRHRRLEQTVEQLRQRR